MTYFRNGMGDGEGFDIISNFLTGIQSNVTGEPGAPAPSSGGSIFDAGGASSTAGSGGVQGLIDFVSGLGASGQFKVVGGVCKPTDEPTLRIVQDLQKQTNRVAAAKSLTKIGVDGDIGPLTLAAVRAAASISGGRVTVDTSSCSALGAQIKTAASQMKAFADAIGAPASTSSPALSKPPSIVTPAGLIKPVASSASLIDAVASMPMPMKVAFGGIMAGIGYFVFFDKPRKKR